MTKRNAWRALVGGVVLIASLAACGMAGPAGTKRGSISGISEVAITLEDGRTVNCLKHSSGYQGGLSCDWEGAA